MNNSFKNFAAVKKKIVLLLVLALIFIIKYKIIQNLYLMFLGPVGSYEILIRLKQNEKQLTCNMYNVYVYTLQHKIY